MLKLLMMHSQKLCFKLKVTLLPARMGISSLELSRKTPIDLPTIKLATEESIRRLDESFFRVRFDRLTPREKEYLHSLAILGDGAQRSGEIADKLKVSPQSIAPIRNSLIKKGMIYSPAYGDMISRFRYLAHF